MKRTYVIPFISVLGAIGCGDKDDPISNAWPDTGDDTGHDDGVDEDDDDGTSDNSGWYIDDDGDGYYGYAAGETDDLDCDDTDPDIHPGAVEVCDDLVDNDCDGWIDGDDAECGGTEGDADGDGYRADDDCDDTDPAVNPGAPEVCADGVDNDCDGEADEEDCEEPASEASGLDWKRLGWCIPEGPVEGLREWRRAASPFVVTE